jgi:N-acetylglucosaminyldiphosphoundecaprenol N-acetyl-beta-D-mannosaminyltransferase
MIPPIRICELLSVRVHNASYEDLLAAARSAASRAIASGTPIFTTYSHFSVLLEARRKHWLRMLLNDAALNVGDGIAVRLAMRAKGVTAPEPVNATDFHHALLDECLRVGARVYLLGGSEAAAAVLPALLAVRFPGCAVRTHHGSTTVDDPSVLEDIRSFSPDVLFLGLGTPLQFEWMDAHLRQLRIPFTAAVGNFLEFAAGTQPRAPRWMRASGLEWLHRLMHEPRRLWRRYIFGIPCFAWFVLRERL